MTYIIAEPCIDLKDRSCVDVCPVDCIHEANRILVIDPEECIDCGACEPECPVEAIFPEDALPAKWEPFVKINGVWLEGEGMVNPLVTAYATEHNVQTAPPDYSCLAPSTRSCASAAAVCSTSVCTSAAYAASKLPPSNGRSAASPWTSSTRSSARSRAIRSWS